MREVAYLDDGDIQMLQVMEEIYRPAIRNRPDMTDPNEFTLLIAGFLRRTDEVRISRDDVYARCSRLSGFGLAVEVLRSDTRMSLSDRCFRPTQRGLRLLRLLASVAPSASSRAPYRTPRKDSHFPRVRPMTLW